MNIPPAPFKGGDAMVNIHEYYAKAIGCKI